MKNLILTFTLLITAYAVSAQNWNSKRTRGNGNITTQERTIEEFSKLKVGGSFKVLLTSERTNELSIKTDENLLEHIITEVKEGALIVKMKKNYYLKPSNYKSITVEIPLKTMQMIALAGSGSIRSTEAMKTDDLKIKMAGSGKINILLEANKINATLAGSGRIELHGNSSYFEAKLSGSGSIKGRDLKSENGDLAISGSGRIEANVSEKLNAKVSGSGSIRYLGEPTTRLNSKVIGSGSVREIKGN